jgi:head-tail adaptor
MHAGQLDRRLRFEKRQDVDDGHGNSVGEFVHQFTVAANRKFLTGGEGVLAARLTARQPAIVTIRNSAAGRGIQAEWQAVDTRDATVYNIREKPKETDDRHWLEMLVESGVAT